MGSQGLGYVLAVVQAILYACMGVMGKYLYGTGLTPEQVTMLRFFGSAAIVAVMIAALRRGPFLSRKPVVYAQALFFAGGAYFYMLSVDELTAGLATVIFYSYPAVVAVLSVVVLHERLSARTVVSLVLAMVGVVLISGLAAPGELRLSPLGIAYGVAACVSFGVYVVLGQKTADKEGQLTLTFTMSAVGSAVMLALFPGQTAFLLHMTALQWALGLSIALFCTVLPVLLLLAAIKRIGAQKASLVSILETPFSLLFAFLVLGETLTGVQGAGSALVVASIVLATLPARRAGKPREDGPAGGGAG